MEIFCLKCKKKVTVQDDKVKKGRSKNNRPLVRAECPTCGSKLAKFVKRKK
ncbi:MAG: DUF5679 domain-containing protein [Candidatus Bathyarchaeota archaeon]